MRREVTRRQTACTTLSENVETVWVLYENDPYTSVRSGITKQKFIYVPYGLVD